MKKTWKSLVDDFKLYFMVKFIAEKSEKLAEEKLARSDQAALDALSVLYSSENAFVSFLVSLVIHTTNFQWLP